MTDTNEELNAMGLGEHLGELRVRLIRSILSVIIIFCIAFSFAETIINFLKGPLVEVLGEGQSALHFTGPMDVLIANIKVSFLTAVVFSCPVWLYQLWKFIEPALYKNEKKIHSAIRFCFYSSFLCWYIFLFFHHSADGFGLSSEAGYGGGNSDHNSCRLFIGSDAFDLRIWPGI